MVNAFRKKPHALCTDMSAIKEKVGMHWRATCYKLFARLLLETGKLGNPLQYLVYKMK